jgi:hypothetical protein
MELPGCVSRKLPLRSSIRKLRALAASHYQFRKGEFFVLLASDLHVNEQDGGPVRKSPPKWQARGKLYPENCNINSQGHNILYVV